MAADSATPERELTAPVTLTRPDGRLNDAAIGWARHPLVDTSAIGQRGWGRNKRWEYWNVATPTHLISLTVSALDYAAVHEVWVFDRATEKTWARSVTVPFARHTVLPGSLGQGPIQARARDLRIDIDDVDEGTRLRASVPGASFDVIAEMPEGHEQLAVVVPWGDTRFQYTVKDVARPARGSVTLDGVTHDVPAGESWAVLDHGRGRWPYDISWNWGAGSGRSFGRTVGLQVGGRWTLGTGATENAVMVDGRIHKIHDELAWIYDLADWRAPWVVAGGGLDARFRPFYDKVTRTNLGILASATDQCFGLWSGSFRTAQGETIPFDGLIGWAEEVHNRW